MIRMEYGRSIRPRDWKEFARLCPRAVPIGGGAILTFDPHGVTIQAVTGSDDDENQTASFLMHWFPEAYGYHPIWLLQTKLHASVQ